MLKWIIRPAAVAALALGFAATAQAATSTAPITPAYQSATTSVSGLASSLVSNFENYTGPGGPRSYSDGVWTSSDEGCWVCSTGPAAADAVLALHAPSEVPVVVNTFDAAISGNQQPDGSFVGAGENPGTNTIFFLQQLGDADVTLKNKLSPATLALWESSIVAGANYLITSGNVNWYANGNLQLAVTEVMYIAWRVSGQAQFLTAYNQSWQFVESPTLPQWPGYGLMITAAPSSASAYDADGAGYLTEDGSSGPGFDPAYTMLQLDVASELFVLSHDSRALTLMNMLVNQELPLINTSTFVLDALNGSRDNLSEGFITTALILLTRYGRSDLQGDVQANVSQIVTSYDYSLTTTSRNSYIGLARDIAPLLMDAAGVQVAPPPGAPTAYLATSGTSTSGVVLGTSSTSAFSMTGAPATPPTTTTTPVPPTTTTTTTATTPAPTATTPAPTTTTPTTVGTTSDPSTPTTVSGSSGAGAASPAATPTTTTKPAKSQTPRDTKGSKSRAGQARAKAASASRARAICRRQGAKETKPAGALSRCIAARGRSKHTK